MLSGSLDSGLRISRASAGEPRPVAATPSSDGAPTILSGNVMRMLRSVLSGTQLVIAGALIAMALPVANAQATPGFKKCPSRPQLLLWHIQVRNASCQAAAQSKRASEATQMIQLSSRVWEYRSVTRWNCLETGFHGRAQDDEVQLWDCSRGAAEALLSDTPYVNSRRIAHPS